MVDDPIRNLVQRLVQMSPEAPPFPEEHMVQLDKRSNEFTPPPRRTGRFGWAIAGAVAVLVLIGLPAYLLGALRFGGDDVAAPASLVTTSDVPPTSTAPNTTVPPTTQLPAEPQFDLSTTLYLLGDYEASNRPGPLLEPVGVHVVAAAEDPIAATLEALVTGTWQGRNDASSEIPEGTRLLGIERNGSTLSVDLSSEFESGGGSASMTARLAQVVYTATSFAEVDDVLFLIDGTPVEVFSAEGIVLDGPQSRDDYQDWLPLVMIETPATGAEIPASTSFEVSGLSNTFEASMSYIVTDLATGEVVVEDFTTATCGSGCWGEFSFMVPVTASDVTNYRIEAFEYSAKDGSKVNIATSIVTVSPQP